MNLAKQLTPFLFFVFTLYFVKQTEAQCVLINEILINGPGACDGVCNPNTEEWTELYNDCSSPINIGCFVLTDGEFTVTIPAGTILAPYDYYVIGSNNSGGTVDLNIATCNCTSGNLIGTYSNSDEQAILINASGIVQDAVYWGVGDFPATITSAQVGSCAPVNINIAAPTAAFTHLSTAGGNGCSMARNCDGNPNWVQRCSTAVSINASNGSVIPKFSASDSTICPGTCISFADLTAGITTTWTWTFAGATSATNSSSSKNPNHVCYNTPGNFPVTLSTATAQCGTFMVSMPAFIHVTALAQPTVTASGPLSFCVGGSVVLQSSTGVAYQWLLNNVAIAGATQQTYTATQAGNYTVKIIEGTCNATSVAQTVTVFSKPNAVITALGPTTICTGGKSALNAGSGFASYQWYNNGALLSGKINDTIQVTSFGNYAVVVSNSGGCKDTSANFTINFSSGYAVTILATDTTLCEGQNANLHISGNFPNIVWSTGASDSAITVNQSGSYSVQVSNSAGCSGLDTIKIKVTPLPLVDAGRDTLGDCNNGIQLNGQGAGTSILWMPATGLDDPTILNPIAKPDESTTYTLVVTNKECSSLDEVTVTVDCGNIYLPNSFSPNADGINDVYRAVGNNINKYELRIYNRWGELVFESNLITVGWDGNYGNMQAPAGVYVREVVALNPLGKSLISEEDAHGIITLIR